MVSQQIDISSLQNMKAVTIPPENKKTYLVKNYQLGAGNYATTYLCTLQSDESQTQACKIIEKDRLIKKLMTSNNPEEKKDFFLKALSNEVRVWMSLSHPNIVQFHDFSETKNNYYFIMEYCKDGTLDQLKNAQGGILQERDVAQILKQMCNGCSYLYNRGVFHRDLKPANVLVNNGVCKIADFGFCKKLEEHKDEQIYQTNVGTPYYMCPQILAGTKYSIKCDIWSLGIICYELVTGQYPWVISSNSQPNDLLEAIMKDNVSFPKSLQISKEFQQIIFKMLQIEEENRINVEELQKLVDNICSQY